MQQILLMNRHTSPHAVRHKEQPMRVFPTTFLITALLTGCTHLTSNEGDNNVKQQGATIDSSDALITFDLRNLSAADVKLGDDVRGVRELTVEQRRDETGSYSLVFLVPERGTPDWFAAFVTLPQVDLPHGAEWIELDAWNPGLPLRLVADCADRNADDFEIGFCPNDTVWEGWSTFRVPLSGDGYQDAEVSLDRSIHPPLRIKWMIVIMRQGKPWQLGLRELRIKPRAAISD